MTKAGRDRRSPDLDRLRSTLRSYMEENGLRSTEQRRVIIEIFLRARRHITIDDLLTLVKAEDSRIGYATVYRTLKMLTAAGVANERRFSDGYTRYELADEDESHHDHLICLDCGRIMEFEDPQIEKLQDRIATRLGFQLQYHKHELYCVCTNADCPHRKDRDSD